MMENQVVKRGVLSFLIGAAVFYLASLLFGALHGPALTALAAVLLGGVVGVLVGLWSLRWQNGAAAEAARDVEDHAGMQGREDAVLLELEEKIVASRKQFDRYLDREWWRAVRSGLPLSLILCELGGLAEFTEHYGEETVNKILQGAPKVLTDIAERLTDQVGIYSEDTFAVLLPDTHEEGAAMLAEAIHSNVEALTFATVDATMVGHIKAYVGISTCVPDRLGRVEDLIEDAEEGLMVSRSNGETVAEVA